MAWKSNTKVCNSSSHPVKGHNPYYSQCTLSVKTDRKCIFCDFAWQFKKIFLTTVRSWEMQFLTDELKVFPSALKTTKFTNFHRTHSVFTDFQGLEIEKRIPFFPNFQRPSKTMWTLQDQDSWSRRDETWEIWKEAVLTSSLGPITLQGPHQVAKKSTTTSFPASAFRTFELKSSCKTTSQI